MTFLPGEHPFLYAGPEDNQPVEAQAVPALPPSDEAAHEAYYEIQPELSDESHKQRCNFGAS